MRTDPKWAIPHAQASLWWQMPLDWDGHPWNWLNYFDDDAIIIHNDENRNISSLRVSSLLKRYREKSHASGTRKETWEQGAGKVTGTTSFPPLLTASKLARAFTCDSKWRGCSQAITFLGIRRHSLFDEPVYIRNSEEKFKLFTYKATSTMAPRLLFTHLNQPWTINNTTALTHAWYTQKSSHPRTTTTPKCMLPQRLVSIWHPSPRRVWNVG